ncbi:hypothetical protein NHQ30_008888 [Ciborinia camelliae]|nr:hypothetical protein NHQ30_008888 [Ciborinia camelliae]
MYRGIISLYMGTSMVNFDQNNVQQVPTIRSRKKGPLRHIGDLKIIPAEFRDNVGEPLLEDSPQGIYLDDLYDESDVKILESLGLKSLSLDNVVARVKQDLNSKDSR